MPTYEYRCSSCGRTFEVVQSFTDAPLTVCDVCGGEVKRVFHPVGIVLKGSGFYSTDNRSGKSLSPGKGDDKKGETKHATTRDSKKGSASSGSSGKAASS